MSPGRGMHLHMWNTFDFFLSRNCEDIDMPIPAANLLMPPVLLQFGVKVSNYCAVEGQVEENGIESLFAVQAMTFDTILEVFTDFEAYGGAVGLAACCVYGGSPYRSQESKLRRGVDIVVGTPGRIKALTISHCS
ncbi:hypothetical protein DVH24_024635 [Malus domestica]|uniref:DEAD/DEAH-box helicase domain-containing protein n=1 Tax=Malus domestica TaxID=3750 RepID=A0A498JNP6_MALDO|nr:hypothetical protein DVH24_024635 [Malus domestica]